MANTIQAKKRALQSEKHRERNASLRSLYRTCIKKVEAAIASSKKDAATTAFKAIVPIIDKMVTRGIVSKNKVARHKSRLNAKIKNLA